MIYFKVDSFVVWHIFKGSILGGMVLGSGVLGGIVI